MPDDPGSKANQPTMNPPTTTPETTTPETTAPEAAADDDEPTGTAGQVAESAAEIALGAIIAPFTGGETVTMVESIKETVEEGVDRLTHLGHHEAAPAEDEGDGSTDDEGASEPPSFYSPGPGLDNQADDGRE